MNPIRGASASAPSHARRRMSPGLDRQQQVCLLPAWHSCTRARCAYSSAGARARWRCAYSSAGVRAFCARVSVRAFIFCACVWSSPAAVRVPLVVRQIGQQQAHEVCPLPALVAVTCVRCPAVRALPSRACAALPCVRCRAVRALPCRACTTLPCVRCRAVRALPYRACAAMPCVRCLAVRAVPCSACAAVPMHARLPPARLPPAHLPPARLPPP